MPDRVCRVRSASIDDKRILLVDDVVTSGATLLELRRAVRAGGGDVAGAVALAGTPGGRSATS